MITKKIVSSTNLEINLKNNLLRTDENKKQFIKKKKQKKKQFIK